MFFYLIKKKIHYHKDYTIAINILEVIGSILLITYIQWFCGNLL